MSQRQRHKIKGWLSAKEAEQILSVTYSGLRNHVNYQRIRTIIPPGTAQMRYSEADVYRLKRDLDAALAVQPARPTEFVKATVADIPSAVALADAVFGGVRTISVDTRIEWLKKNPDIDYLLKQEGQVVGYISLVPLTLETIDDLLNQRRFARELTGDDILKYVPTQPVDIYGMAIGTAPGVSKAQKREWGAALLRGAQDVLEDLAMRGIVIHSLRAHSNTPDGIRLMRHLGFTETAASIPNMRDFVIDVENSGIPFIVRYKKRLADWQSENDKPASKERPARRKAASNRQ